MNIQQLRTKAKELGIPMTRNDTTETIAAKIAQAEGEKPVWNTPEEFFDAVSPYVAKGLEAAVAESESTWQVKKGIACDSGHLSMPLHVIKRKAEAVLGAPRGPVLTEHGLNW